MKKEYLPYEKFCLSIEEASDFSMIGERKLREIISNNPNYDWILNVGSWVRIKRPQFEKWLMEINYV